MYRHYRDRKFKCGEDDDGHSIRIKLKHFFRYTATQNDDSPLYIFDSRYDEDSVSKQLLKDYDIPEYFRDDLFNLISEKRRPPYRWFLVGPERSGTSVHIDPLGTSAWNALIAGRKRWVLFPPHVSRSVAKSKHLRQKGEDDEPIAYFSQILPRLKTEIQQLGQMSDIIEFIQCPGEVVFIPGGWWHAVINLDDTIAVTQNFLHRTRFEEMWPTIRKERKVMARKWLQTLEQKEPELAQVS